MPFNTFYLPMIKHLPIISILAVLYLQQSNFEMIFLVIPGFRWAKNILRGHRLQIWYSSSVRFLSYNIVMQRDLALRSVLYKIWHDKGYNINSNLVSSTADVELKSVHLQAFISWCQLKKWRYVDLFEGQQIAILLVSCMRPIYDLHMLNYM